MSQERTTSIKPHVMCARQATTVQTYSTCRWSALTISTPLLVLLVAETAITAQQATLAKPQMSRPPNAQKVITPQWVPLEPLIWSVGHVRLVTTAHPRIQRLRLKMTCTMLSKDRLSRSRCHPDSSGLLEISLLLDVVLAHTGTLQRQPAPSVMLEITAHSTLATQMMTLI